MGNEHSQSSGSSNHSSSRFRASAKLLHRSGSKRLVGDIPSVKKVKLPEGKVVTTATDGQARERLLSCPDHHHHTESEMVKRVERLLTQKVTINNDDDARPVCENQNIALFDGAQPPKISIASYVQRLIYYLGGIAENERNVGIDVGVHSDMAVRYLISAIIYLERIQSRTGLVITMYNIHRLIITGTMIAAKVLDDIQPNQKYFSDLGGVSTLELARLELAFLALCDYNVNVDPELFATKYAHALDRERIFSDGADALCQGAFSPRPTPKVNEMKL